MKEPTERGVVGRVIGYSVLAVVVVGLIIGGIFGARVLFADPIGRGEAEITTSGGDYRIAAYDHFTDLCALVQAKEDQIKSQQAELEATSDPQRKAQLRANLTALRASRAGLIREYNGDASKDYTVGQFRDSDLPPRLDIDAKETQCAL